MIYVIEHSGPGAEINEPDMSASGNKSDESGKYKIRRWWCWWQRKGRW